MSFIIAKRRFLLTGNIVCNILLLRYKNVDFIDCRIFTAVLRICFFILCCRGVSEVGQRKATYKLDTEFMKYL